MVAVIDSAAQLLFPRQWRCEQLEHHTRKGVIQHTSCKIENGFGTDQAIESCVWIEKPWATHWFRRSNSTWISPLTRAWQRLANVCHPCNMFCLVFHPLYKNKVNRANHFIIVVLRDQYIDDGKHPMLTAATSAGKVFIHNPHEKDHKNQSM